MESSHQKSKCACLQKDEGSECNISLWWSLFARDPILLNTHIPQGMRSLMAYDENQNS